jgi:hypothetical protein
MKTFLISAATLAALGGGAAAWADPPSEIVPTPANPSSHAESRAYTDALMDAIDHTCRRATNPTVGFNLLRFESCRESERDHIAATEPTGLFAARLGITRDQAETRLARMHIEDEFDS